MDSNTPTTGQSKGNPPDLQDSKGPIFGTPTTDEPEITLAFCGPPPAKCDHDWRGPFRAFPDGRGGEATCLKCGAGAFNEWEIWT